MNKLLFIFLVGIALGVVLTTIYTVIKSTLNLMDEVDKDELELRN